MERLRWCYKNCLLISLDKLTISAILSLTFQQPLQRRLLWFTTLVYNFGSDAELIAFVQKNIKLNLDHDYTNGNKYVNATVSFIGREIATDQKISSFLGG